MEQLSESEDDDYDDEDEELGGMRFDARRYDRKLKEVQELKCQLLENQLQEKLRIKEMGYKYNNNHSLRQKHFGNDFSVEKTKSNHQSNDYDRDSNFIFLTNTNGGTVSKKRRNQTQSFDCDYVISTSSRGEGVGTEDHDREDGTLES